MTAIVNTAPISAVNLRLIVHLFGLKAPRLGKGLTLALLNVGCRFQQRGVKSLSRFTTWGSTRISSPEANWAAKVGPLAVALRPGQWTRVSSGPAMAPLLFVAVL